MVRPRNILMNSFPPGTVTPEQVSNALRQAGGEMERAKKILEASSSSSSAAAAGGEKGNNPKKEPNSPHIVADTKQASEISSDDAVTDRLPPRSVVSINNLSDRKYCCVWHVEAFEDGYRPEVARALLAKAARHVNPILRERGWRVKRLIESASRQWIGCCTGNGRDDADAASTNIQLNLRVEPNKHCQLFRSFEQIMSVMLHEITHTSIGLEDIHPPAFYELLKEIRLQYQEKLENGEVAKETDDYGCNSIFVTSSGQVSTVAKAASGIVEPPMLEVPLFDSNEKCGVKKRRKRRLRGTKRSSAGKAMGSVALQKQEKRRPLLKGAKLIDKRTKSGRAAMATRESIPARELAARAALARFGNNNGAAERQEDEEEYSSEESNEDELIAPHVEGCACRGCAWHKMLVAPK